MAPTREGEYGRALRGGVAAGLAGGVVLAVYRVIIAPAYGTDAWIALKMPAAPLLPERALSPGLDPGAVVAGILCHLAVSALWGLLFGLYFYGMSPAWLVITGLVWGVFVWFFMFRLVLPLLGLLSVEASTTDSLAIFGHVLYGLASAIGFLPFQRAEDVA